MSYEENCQTSEADDDAVFTSIYCTQCYNHLHQLVMRKFDTARNYREITKKSKKLVAM